jgi:hypothetical protein
LRAGRVKQARVALTTSNASFVRTYTEDQKQSRNGFTAPIIA